MAIKDLYPSILPTLDLNFAETRTVDPRITFTRASTATYFDEFGAMRTALANVPRIDFYPTTLECKGLLIEEQRTNLLLNSYTLATQNVTVTAVAHTLTFYGTGTVTLSGAATGVLVGTGAANRVALTFTPTAGILTLTVTGSCSQGQLELGTFPTSYIPTTSAQATRAADNAVITGSNFSSWYRQDEGTIYSDWSSVGSLSDNRIVYSISDGTISNSHHIIAAVGGAGNRTDVIFRSAGLTTSALGVGGTYTNYAPRKISAAYKVDSFEASADGASTEKDVNGQVMISPNRMCIGANWAGNDNRINGHIRKIAYYPNRLSSTNLQALTI